MRRPASRSATRSLAHALATATSMEMGSSDRAAVSVQTAISGDSIRRCQDAGPQFPDGDGGHGQAIGQRCDVDGATQFAGDEHRHGVELLRRRDEIAAMALEQWLMRVTEGYGDRPARRSRHR